MHGELGLLAGDHTAIGKATPLAIGEGWRDFEIAVPVDPARLSAGDGWRHGHDVTRSEAFRHMLIELTGQALGPFAKPGEGCAGLSRRLDGREWEQPRLDCVLHPLVARFDCLEAIQLEGR